MPPRTRSGRAEKLEAEKLLRSGRTNISGLPVVPAEILLAIVSHLPSIPIPCGRSFQRAIPMRYLERSKTLNSISQTCRSLRSVALPVLWQKIEVGVEWHNHRDKSYAKRLATELVRQLEIVTIRDPSLAQYVREVTVCLNAYSQDTVFPELVRSLHMFPSMHSLQIISSDSSVAVARGIDKAFEGHTFSNVKLLVLNGPIFTIVKSFPEIQSCYTDSTMDFCTRWEEILDNWGGITKLQGLIVRDRHVLEKVTGRLPRLEYLEVQADDLLGHSGGAIALMPTPELLQQLAILKLVILRNVTSENRSSVKKNMQPLLARIRSLLKGFDVTSGVQLVIIEFRSLTSFFGMESSTFEEVYRVRC